MRLSWPELVAYAGYLLWLIAGFSDFTCHRRARLAITSGLRESMLHLRQIVLLGAGIVGWLTFEPTAFLFLIFLALNVAHAWTGYLDTRSAYGVRPITPLEQHLHSILDCAPWAALAVVGCGVVSMDSAPDGLRFRATPFALTTWCGVVLPAFALVVLPALAENRACRRAVRRDR